MSTVKVTAIAQYNDENGKPKGGRKFEFTVNTEVFMYSDNQGSIIQAMINEWQAKHNYCGTYTYVEHEIDFFDVVQLDGDRFVALEANSPVREPQAIPEPTQDDVFETLYKAFTPNTDKKF